jgi:hypothetical protein
MLPEGPQVPPTAVLVHGPPKLVNQNGVQRGYRVMSALARTAASTPAARQAACEIPLRSE